MTLAASSIPSTPDLLSAPAQPDLQIALAQLAVELLVQAPRRVRREYLAAAGELLRTARWMLSDENRWVVVGETREGLEEVVAGLEELGVF